jgi:rhodanese-related sulfurtransferase
VSAINSISVDKLVRLIGTPRCPALIDVRPNDDFDSGPRLIPGSVRRTHSDVSEWAGDFNGQSAVVICRDGTALSQGTAAWLRHAGVAADVLESGFEGWARAALPLLTASKIPPLDGQRRSVWVTRARPKVDRVACPWLIRRFIDPRAVFLFVAASDVPDVAERYGAAPFDLDGVFWSHRGDKCTFDLMIEEFGLTTEPLLRLATIIRGADPGIRTSRRKPPGCWPHRSDCRECTPTISRSSKPGFRSTTLSIAGAATRSKRPTSRTPNGPAFSLWASGCKIDQRKNMKAKGP